MKKVFSKNIIFFQEYHHSVKQFGSRSGPTTSGPDLDANCLPRPSADNAGHSGSVGRILESKGS